MKYKYDEFNRNEFESHRLVINFVEAGSKVLDLGCATGYMAKELSKQNCETWGVDSDAVALKKATKYYKKVIFRNLDETKSLSVPKKYFDYVMVLDVIEHLLHPEIILSTLKTYLNHDGKLIISIPNIAHASIRWMLARGEFRYSSTGILDNTHVHFYTRDGITKLLKRLGFRVLKVVPTNGMCKVPFLYKITDRLPVSWQYCWSKKYPRCLLFSL